MDFGHFEHASNPFGGLVVSMLASVTRVRRFKLGRSRWIFRASEKSSACLPSEGKWKNLYHVPALRHVKGPSTSVNYECASKIPCIVTSFAGRGLLCLCDAWRPWRWMKGTYWGKGTIGLQAAVPKRPHRRPLTFNSTPQIYLVSRLHIRGSTIPFPHSIHIYLLRASCVVSGSSRT